MMTQSISLTITLDDPTELPRVFEVLSRAAAGLLLDGVESSIHAHQFDLSEITDTED